MRKIFTTRDGVNTLCINKMIDTVGNGAIKIFLLPTIISTPLNIISPRYSIAAVSSIAIYVEGYAPYKMDEIFQQIIIVW